MALEELGIALQIAGDGFLLGLHRRKPASLSCRHSVSDLDMTFE
jgi:hypothetical protein